ncbi:hypothetical protein [uncultured Tenacibaculum sp.]|uniref:hypothetical protein n=1 Tax=uncultured Tenacibaculum sp. TaxID=174713 RepID=UPI00260AF84F|nr:hypothetical protein [uncultured Tenacibaculum sp.]
MKLKVTTYFFVLLYLIAMLRPIAPFVEYAINYDYIAKVLCINTDKPELSCNGKCHLKKKLQQQQEEDYNSLRIAMEEYPIGFVSVLEVRKRVHPKQKQKSNFGYHKNYKFLYHPSVFHPPTA